MLHKTILNQ